MTTATTPRPLPLRDYELRRLRDTGSVCVVRVSKRQPVPARDIFGAPAARADDLAWPIGGGFYAIIGSPSGLNDILDTCPFGRVGDVVAVKEAWAFEDCYDPEAEVQNCDMVWYRAGGWQSYEPGTHNSVFINHKDTDLSRVKVYTDGWRSPATMPLWAVRTFAVLASVRAGQVQGVTEAEAVAAGIVVDDMTCHCGGRYGDHTISSEHAPVLMDDIVAGEHEGFAALHNAHTRNPAHKWERNPWCFIGVFQLRGDE